MASLAIPEVQHYPAHTTAGINYAVPMGPEFVAAIDEGFGKVAGWLGENGITAIGPTYIRYNVINMEGVMRVEIGWFVDDAIPVEVAAQAGEIVVAESPAGEYVVTRYTGHYDGLMNATAMLIGWAKQTGVQWDAWETPEGEAFAARYEIYHSDPAEEPDPEKWVTELAFKTRDAA